MQMLDFPTPFGEAAHILKCEATHCRKDEHWFAILDKGMATLCRVVMDTDQARITASAAHLTAIAPAEYLAAINKGKARCATKQN